MHSIPVRLLLLGLGYEMLMLWLQIERTNHGREYNY